MDSPNPPAVSFEFFPPLDAAGSEALWASITRLAPLRPAFVSVTYGADGSTRDRTFAAIARLTGETALTAAPHVTCVGARREDVQALARRYRELGIRHLVALRGDPPAGERFAPVPGGYAHAADLVEGLRAVADFEISVAGYPETHPEARSPQADVEHLRAKCAAGASRVITQFFFDADVFLRFRDRCTATGVHATLVPGILPVTRFPQLVRFASRCGASIPAWLARRFHGLDEDADTRQMIAAATAIELVTRLRREGVRDFHFYTLNRPELTYAICHAIGLRPLDARSRDATDPPPVPGQPPTGTAGTAGRRSVA